MPARRCTPPAPRCRSATASNRRARRSRPVRRRPSSSSSSRRRGGWPGSEMQTPDAAGAGAPTGFARTPRPPYYAVIFTSLRRDGDHGYGETADRMVELAATQPGYLGIESVRGDDGLGITVSYWETEAHIAAWRRDA